MKLITVILKQNKLENIRKALIEINITGITATEVKGFGRQKGHKEFYRGSPYDVVFLPKIKLEIAVSATQLDNAIKTIMNVAHTGKAGDGKIFVSNLEKIIRISSGETNQDAI